MKKNDEHAFLEQYSDAQYAKFSITSDILTFTVDQHDSEHFKFQLLLLKRSTFPFKDFWSIPGGFLQPSETLDDAAIRISKKKTNIDLSYLEQLYTFSSIDRDPRTRIISTTFLNIVHKNECILSEDCSWFDIETIMKKKKGDAFEMTVFLSSENENLKITCDIVTATTSSYLKKTNYEFNITHSDVAFDHAKIICMGILRLKSKLDYSNIALHFMPEKFTLPALQKVYECILTKTFNKTPFRNKVRSFVEKTGEKEKIEGFSKPSELYRYKKEDSYDFT